MQVNYWGYQKFVGMKLIHVTSIYILQIGISWLILTERSKGYFGALSTNFIHAVLSPLRVVPLLIVHRFTRMTWWFSWHPIMKTLLVCGRCWTSSRAPLGSSQMLINVWPHPSPRCSKPSHAWSLPFVQVSGNPAVACSPEACGGAGPGWFCCGKSKTTHLEVRSPYSCRSSPIDQGHVVGYPNPYEHCLLPFLLGNRPDW